MARAQLTGILLAQTTTYVGLQLFMFVAPWWALGFTKSYEILLIHSPNIPPATSEIGCSSG
ncbi:MAG: hypothetical protein KatS3mg071_1442 [Meiothermus sp.]|nr:MAG: hypothetical protein KatS3mg071_1442 [Meiothermus sp.]